MADERIIEEADATEDLVDHRFFDLRLPEWADGTGDFLGPRPDFSSFGQLASNLAGDPRGLSFLTGFEHGLAGISPEWILDVMTGNASSSRARLMWATANQSISGLPGPRALSFCLNGLTYTAVSDLSEDGMGLLVCREGNHCALETEACALVPRFCGREWIDNQRVEWTCELDDPRSALAVKFELLLPGSSEAALVFGSGEDAWDSYFIGNFNRQVYEKARALNLAFARELDASVPCPPPSSSAPPRLRL